MKRLFNKFLWLFTMLLVLGCGLLPFSQPTDSHQREKTNPSTTPIDNLPVPQPTANLDSLPTLNELTPGWHQIDPGGNTSCARGDRYSFFVRKAKSDKLLIYFEGGGSCYDAETCRVGGNYFDDSIDPTFVADNPALKADGVFALSNPDNPFADYNIVFVSYCTGDAFLGANIVSYQYGNYTFQVNHLGFVNTHTVLSWTYQNYSKPSSVFVIGCSAGVVGSFFHSPYILEHYKTIPAAVVGDSGGGYLNGPASYVEQVGTMSLVPNWLPQYQDLISNNLIQTKLFFTIPPQAYPKVHFGLVDTQNDGVQAEIISRLNINLTLADVLQSNYADIRAATPSNFYVFTGPGDNHCITMSPAFDEYEVNNTKLSDWFANLAAGQPVENIGP